ncbi:MAG: DUF421 domain-containing protein [candidate division FCPU426 bacterium]
MHTSLLEVIFRTAVIYAMLYAALRMMGKRELSQFSAFDLILLLTLANSVQNAMVGDNSSLSAGIAAALTLLVFNFLLNVLLSRNLRMRRFIEGVPTLLVRHGKVEWKGLHRERMDMDDLMTALREHGFRKIDDVDLAVLELDGSVSVMGAPERRSRPQPKRQRRHVKLTSQS